MEKLIERFIKYTRMNTRSVYESGTHPSTAQQFDFARILEAELREIGLADVRLSDTCYITATLPSNIGANAPVVGFIAHMDTSPDMTAENVQPKRIQNYDGKDIVLNSDKQIIMSPSEFPSLLNYTGQDLIVTDGCTLLGADDKAGIAEIVTAMEYLIAHPDVRHGKIRICITPDEEIGEGADNFDVAGFGADFAYTMDGDELGTLEFENFNAARADVVINGKNIHPGSAKNKMANSILIGMEFNSMLPAAETPSHTEGYEGFYHLNDMEGTVEKTMLKYIVRDHDRAKFESRKKSIAAIASYLNDKYGSGTVELNLKDQYYNMKEKILPVYHIIELAIKAMEQAGVTPRIKAIRGGTDGARLTFMGLPTPNVFTGGSNFHGRYEFAAVNSMLRAVDVIVKIAELAAAETKR
ncbi:MAG: peptidase T [Clostridiaceae bacterium]